MTRAGAIVAAFCLAFSGVAPAVLALCCSPDMPRSCCAELAAKSDRTWQRALPSCCQGEAAESKVAPPTTMVPETERAAAVGTPVVVVVQTLVPPVALHVFVAQVEGSPPPRASNGPPLPLRI